MENMKEQTVLETTEELILGETGSADVIEYQPLSEEQLEESHDEQVSDTKASGATPGNRAAQTLRVIVEGYDPSKIKDEDENSHVDQTWKEIYRAYTNRMIMQARMVGMEIKLGKPCAVVRLNHVTGYIPLDLSGFDNTKQMENFIGEVIAFKILNYDRDGDVFTASRVAALEHMAGLTWKRIAVGQIAPAVVRRVDPKRLRLDIGGILVNVPATEVDYGWVDDLREKYRTGDQVKVKIMEVNLEKKEIKVSMKALKRDPWPDCTRRYRLHAEYVGTISGIEEYGVFVRLENGVDSLCRHPRNQTILHKGDEVLVRITNIDVENKHFSGKILKKL
jgi:small subunit ribosomal protein S1